MVGFIKLALLVGCIGLATCLFPKPDCTKSGAELWPRANINEYWLCAEGTQEPILAHCQPDHGFLRTSDVSGCIPFTDWKCTSKDFTPPSCKNVENTSRPHRHPNPNMYWVCSDDILLATNLTCPENMGFVDNAVHLGCIEFESADTKNPVWVCQEDGNMTRE